MQVKTLTAIDKTMEFKIGYLEIPVNWEVDIFVDNIGAVTLNVQKNFNPNPAGTPLWKTIGTAPTINANGTKTLKLVGGGHFKIVPSADPVNVFVAVSY